MKEPTHPIIPSSTEGKAMEGRSIMTDGTDLGDRAFHEQGWGTTPEAAKSDLERMTSVEIDLGIQQAESFATEDRAMGASAYEGLCKLYPSDPRRDAWNQRASVLRQK